MTERDFEQFLRAGFRATVDRAAPSELRASVLAVPDVVGPIPQRRLTGGWRFPTLDRFAPIALAATAVVVAIMVGIGLFVRLSPNVGPSPAPAPTREATAAPNLPLGGGLMIVHAAYVPPNYLSSPSPLDVFTLDAGTGQRTLLGTLRVAGMGPLINRSTFEWGADRKHVLITRNGGPLQLDNPTAAARDLTFVCCQQLQGYAWVLSPQSDRIAGLHDGLVNVAGCGLCGAVPDSILILDLDRGDLRTLPLPPGSYGSQEGISWAPDGSAVVIGGCRPCNDRYSPGIADITPTAVEHGHLFIVPVDGSPVRELLDATETGLYSPAWSPDGTTIAFGRYECAADEHAPYCHHGTNQLVTLTVANGQDNVVADATGGRPEWSPDGRRIAFADETSIFVMAADGSHLAMLTDGRDPRWSPDGQWLVFSTYDETLGTTNGPWIIAASGGEPRLLGPYGGWGW